MLATLIGNLDGMVFRCCNDGQRTMEYASAGSLRLTGYAPEELLGNRRVSYTDLIHGEDRERVASACGAGGARGERE
jgi:PAS domain-containing protein